MTSIEQQLRAAMRAHEHDAPSAAGLTVPGKQSANPPAAARHRRLQQPLLALLAILILGAAITTFALGTHHRGTPTPATHSGPPGPVTALSCPAEAPQRTAATPAVPARPQGVDGTARLAPAQVPSRVLVCAYLGPRSPSGRSGSAVLTGDLSGVANDLAWAPVDTHPSGRVCSADLRITDGDDYLIGLSYPGSTLWIAAPADHCSGAANGQFDSYQNVSGRALAWYRAGHWVSTAPSNPCLAGGRLGEQAKLVPDQPVSVTLCQEVGNGNRRVLKQSDQAGATRLASALNALPTHSLGMSQQLAGRFLDYDLAFHYAHGPDLVVEVMASLDPAIQNGSLQATSAATVLPIINSLLHGG